MGRFEVRPSNPKLPASSFSGGNQQKIVLAKWLQPSPSVLLLDEPTQGVDAGARKQILELICDAAASGMCVGMFSTDLEQLAAVCHRVLVLRGGEIVSEYSGQELTEDA